MRVKVRLGGSLPAMTGRSSEQALDLPDGTTIAEALSAAGVKPGLVMLVSVGGHIYPVSHSLSDGDDLVVVPPVSGG